MITPAFTAAVEEARALGLSWPQVSRRLGRPVRTCQRAIGVGQPPKVCAHAHCTEPATMNGKLCPEHARKAMANKPGEGFRQQQVIKLVRKHGLLTSEQLRNFTGMDSSLLSHVTRSLILRGMLEKPLRNHFRLPTTDHD